MYAHTHTYIYIYIYIYVYMEQGLHVVAHMKEF